MKIEPAKHWLTARDTYFDELSSLVTKYSDADILELGGGRRPSFAISDLPVNLNSYTVNDIDANELALAAPDYEKACFDVSGEVENFSNRYDVVFSRFLAEHVANGEAMHRNVLKVLKPGGVAFHLIPTLYASPFLFNLAFPEQISHKLLVKFFPFRKTGALKFPAHYSYCFGDTEKMRSAFAKFGYSRGRNSEFLRP